MKAVLLAGGLGTRMREETEFRPKPMVDIGGMPVLWHLMKNLSTQGIREFVVLTGYKGEQITEFFANLAHLRRHTTFDFTQLGDANNSAVELDLDWKVDIVRTGDETPTGGRLLAAMDVIGGEPFLCTYGDGLADVDLEKLIGGHLESGQSATMTVVQPSNRFGVVDIGSDDSVIAFREKPRMTDWINIGFFIFSSDLFGYLERDEMLEDTALVGLARDSKLRVNRHFGFWEPMDTYREYQHLNSLWKDGAAPWKNWE